MNKIDALEAEQPKKVTDAFIVDYDYVNDDGDKITDNSYTHPEFGEQEIKINMSKLFRAGLSTTTDVSLLVAEAELLEEDRCGENPHIPASMEILEQAKDRIEARGLTPAWTIFDDDRDGQSVQEATAD